MTTHTIHPLRAMIKGRVGAVGGLEIGANGQMLDKRERAIKTDCDENERHEETAPTETHRG